MFNSYMKYSFVLIALYLGLTHASNGGILMTQGAAGIATINKSLQGR